MSTTHLPTRLAESMGLADLPLLAPVAPLPPNSRAEPATTRTWIESDIPHFLASEGIEQLQLFLTRLSAASVGYPTLVLKSEQESRLPSSIQAVGQLLRTLLRSIDDFAPRTEAQRYGNLAFREYGHSVEQRAVQLHLDFLPQPVHPYVPELTPYLVGGLGSFVRLDYGTGHELAFLAWLTFLARLGLFGETASPGAPHTSVPPSETERLVALYLIPLYLQLVWTLQDVYRLEPAGSHGAWGLDDYCFVPYILGAAQLSSPGSLSSDPTLVGGGYTPRQISDPMHKPAAVAGERATSGPRTTVPPHQLLSFIPRPTAKLSRSTGPEWANLFSSALARIHVLKRGPFAEHSPLLWDLSGTVPTWSKMYVGMRKMWTAEVLGKVPVVQHFFFGTHAYPWKGPTHTRESSGRGKSTHAQSHPLTTLPTAPPRLMAPTRPGVSAPGSNPTPAPWALASTSTTTTTTTTTGPPGRTTMPSKLPPASSTFVGSAAPAPIRLGGGTRAPGAGASVGTAAPWAATAAPRPQPHLPTRAPPPPRTDPPTFQPTPKPKPKPTSKDEDHDHKL